MEEVSNRTIAGLLVVAMVISLTGTFFSLSKLDMLQKDSGFTGFGINPNATASLEIGDVTSIDFLVVSVDWGAGSVNSTDNVFCNLTTLNYSSGGYSSACVDFAGTQPGMLVLKNDGNRHVSVTLTTNASSAAWLGDSSGAIYFEAYDNNTNPCKSGRAGLNTLIPATPSTATVCTNFTFTAGEDQLNIPLLAKVPYNISTGVKNVQLRAVATAV